MGAMWLEVKMYVGCRPLCTTAEFVGCSRCNNIFLPPGKLLCSNLCGSFARWLYKTCKKQTTSASYQRMIKRSR